MNYPVAFPIKFRADADAALARAKKHFFEKARQLPKPRNFGVRENLEQLLKERVRTNVADFGKLACKAVKEGLLRPDLAGPGMREFLQIMSREAYNDADHLYGGGFYYSFPELEQEITTSDEWMEYVEEFAKGPLTEPAVSAEKAAKEDCGEPSNEIEGGSPTSSKNYAPVDTDRPPSNVGRVPVGLETAGGQEAMTQPRDFANEFRKLAVNDTAITNLLWDGYGGLRFHYDYDVIETGEWVPAHVPNAGFLAEVEELLTEMGIDLGVPPGVRPRDYALHCIVKEHRAQQSPLLYGDNDRGGVLLRVCEAANTFDLWRSTRKLEEKHGYLSAAAVNPVWFRLLKGFREVQDKTPQLRITSFGAEWDWENIKADDDERSGWSLFVLHASLAGTVVGFPGKDPRGAVNHWLNRVRDHLSGSGDETLSVASDGTFTITGLGEVSAKCVERIINQTLPDDSKPLRQSGENEHSRREAGAPVAARAAGSEPAQRAVIWSNTQATEANESSVRAERPRLVSGAGEATEGSTTKEGDTSTSPHPQQAIVETDAKAAKDETRGATAAQRESLVDKLNVAENRTVDPKLKKMLVAVLCHEHYMDELKQLKQASRKHRVPGSLRAEFPGFDVWAALNSEDHMDLAKGDFHPGRFAWSLVKRHLRLTGKDDRTLKNYRKELKTAGLRE